MVQNMIQAAAALGVTVAKLGRWCDKGWIPSTGGRVQRRPRLFDAAAMARARWVQSLVAAGKTDTEITRIVGVVLREEDGMDMIDELREPSEGLAAANGPSMLTEAASRSVAEAKEAVVTAFTRYKSECALAGREPLKFSEWRVHDRVLRPAIHRLAEAIVDAPTVTLKEAATSLTAELKARATALQKQEPGLSLSSAMGKVLHQDEDLRRRHRAAFIPRATPTP
jgi:hypothetical protein